MWKFIEKGWSFSHVSETGDTTINNKKYLTYQYHLKQLMQMCELLLNRKYDGAPHLKNALDWGINNLLLRKYTYLN